VSAGTPLTLRDLVSCWLDAREELRGVEGWYIDVRENPTRADELRAETASLWEAIVGAAGGETEARAFVNRRLLG
jgi:hypothetical protein